jgi:hypothetical protein
MRQGLNFTVFCITALYAQALNYSHFSTGWILNKMVLVNVLVHNITGGKSEQGCDKQKQSGNSSEERRFFHCCLLLLKLF